MKAYKIRVLNKKIAMKYLNTLLEILINFIIEIIKFRVRLDGLEPPTVSV